MSIQNFYYTSWRTLRSRDHDPALVTRSGLSTFFTPGVRLFPGAATTVRLNTAAGQVSASENSAFASMCGTRHRRVEKFGVQKDGGKCHMSKLLGFALLF